MTTKGDSVYISHKLNRLFFMSKLDNSTKNFLNFRNQRKKIPVKCFKLIDTRK